MRLSESLLAPAGPVQTSSPPAPRVEIRDAVAADRADVFDLIDRALMPYYGGDHRAHAQRIFAAHIDGGRDTLGHFSFEQKMLVATVDGEFAGILHLVGKRQDTYKISPLIVGIRYRRIYGVATALLRHAEAYVGGRNARQLYCTVAEANSDAMNFFERNGFLRAGMSASHYKVGMREHMLYKLLGGSGLGSTTNGNATTVSVVAFHDQYATAVRKMILGSSLVTDFIGVDDEWIDSLFAGYRRRQSADVNVKYKLIYVAISRSGEVVGVCGATPKKGEPIKLMPLVASSRDAFASLLTELPWALRPFGHKLYAHLTPSVEQTVELQRLGWQLDAAMPGAYHNDRVTQQWSRDLGGSDVRDLLVKRQYFDLICSGRKTLEVRVAYASMQTLRSGDEIRLMSGDLRQLVRVVAVRHYANFDKMLDEEDVERILPHLSGVESREEALRILRGIYNADREKKGVVVMEIDRRGGSFKEGDLAAWGARQDGAARTSGRPARLRRTGRGTRVGAESERPGR